MRYGVMPAVGLAGLFVPAMALADDGAPVPRVLPTFAQNPATTASPWTGFHFGTEMFVVSRKGAKGGVGGGITAGYDHAFDNRLVLGVQVSTGYAPSVFAGNPFVNGSARGFDYATADVKVGYDMGRWMPYVTTGVVLAKPVGGTGPNYVNAAQSVNDLFNATRDVKAAARVGGGVDYAVTNNLTVGLSASVGDSRALIAPRGW